MEVTLLDIVTLVNLLQSENALPAKTFYLKDTAKILNLPVDNGLPNYDELASWAEQPVERFIAYHSPSEMIPVCATALHVR